MVELKQTSIRDIFTQQAAAFPNNIAVRHGATTLTYLELQQKAQRLAALLQSHGVGPDVVVGICGDRSPDYIVAVLATVIAGGAYLPIDPNLPQQRIDLILHDAQPQVTLAAHSALGLFSNPEYEVIGLEEAAWTPLGGNPAPVCLPSSAEDLAYIMYTSGSTGRPKGVCIPQRGIIRLVRGADYVTLGPDTTLLQMAPFSFDASTLEIWGSLLNGGTCVLMPYDKPSLQQIEQVLLDEGVTTLWLTTALFLELAERRPLAFRKLREVLTGGEVIPAAAVKRVLSCNPGLTLIACYGPTECTTFACTHRYTSAGEVGDVVPLGRPIPQTEAYVLRDDLSVADAGEEGELYIGGAGLARSYLNLPELTTQSFIGHPFSADPEDRLYRTGDICMYTANGELIFKGRRDRQIKLRGFRIELGEIEAALHQHPQVQSAIVKAETTASGDKTLVAYVVPKSSALAADPVRDEEVVSERTRQWQDVYSRLLYKSLASSDFAGNDPTFNTSGWKSSFDGRPISHDEMQEHVGETVRRILALSPRSVLEIGCGTGMLLFRVAPHCESYVGTDFSAAVLDYVQQRLGSVPGLKNVTLLQRTAHDLPEPPEGGFDVVILNSVSEHFSSLQYLDGLLRKIAGVVRDGGYVFVGDNRNFPLLPHFHAAIQLGKAPGTLQLPSFAVQVEQEIADERQLTIDPAFFVQADRSKFRSVSVQFRRGHHQNELTGYRYDAILEVGNGDSARARQAPQAPIADNRPWHAAADSISSARKALETDRPDVLVRSGVPNRRLAGAGALLDALSGTTSLRTAGELRRAMDADTTGEDPESFWQLGEELGYDVKVIPTFGAVDGRFDVVFHREANPAFDAALTVVQAPPKPLREFANDPLLSWRMEELSGQLRRHLGDRLPDHAVPSFLVMLQRFPRNVNGKVDASILPLPARLRNVDALAATAGDSAGTAFEKHIRGAWESVLGVRNISLDEKFFEIGGDSLKAVRLAAELSHVLNMDVSPAHIFEEPTIRGLAKRLQQRLPASAPSSRGRQRRAQLVGDRLQPVAASAKADALQEAAL